MGEFQPINPELLVIVGKPAERYAKMLSRYGIDDKTKQKAYFLFLEIFGAFYRHKSDATTYGNIMDVLERNKGVLDNFNGGNIVALCFWNVFLTTDSEGRECEKDEFLASVESRFGKHQVYQFFKGNADTVFPYCKKYKKRKYRLTIGAYGKKCVLTFTAKISDALICSLLERILEAYDTAEEEAKVFFELRNVEYSKLKWTEENMDYAKAISLAGSIINRPNNTLGCYMPEDVADALSGDCNYIIMQTSDSGKYAEYLHFVSKIERIDGAFYGKTISQIVKEPDPDSENGDNGYEFKFLMLGDVITQQAIFEEIIPYERKDAEDLVELLREWDGLGCADDVCHYYDIHD